MASGGMVSTASVAVEMTRSSRAAEEPGDQPEQRADGRADQPGDQAEAQRLRGRGDDHREQVAAAAIGAEQVVGRRAAGWSVPRSGGPSRYRPAAGR